MVMAAQRRGRWLADGMRSAYSRGPPRARIAVGSSGTDGAGTLYRSEDQVRNRAPMKDRRDDDSDRQTRSLAGLAVVLALAVAALFLVQHLKRESRIEDCLMAGRSNCDALIDR